MLTNYMAAADWRSIILYKFIGVRPKTSIEKLQNSSYYSHSKYCEILGNFYLNAKTRTKMQNSKRFKFFNLSLN